MAQSWAEAQVTHLPRESIQTRNDISPTEINCRKANLDRLKNFSSPRGMAVATTSLTTEAPAPRIQCPIAFFSNSIKHITHFDIMTYIYVPFANFERYGTSRFAHVNCYH